MGVPEHPKNAKGLTAYEIAIRTSHDCQSVSEVMYYYLFLNFRLAHSAFTPGAANRGVDVDSLMTPDRTFVLRTPARQARVFGQVFECELLVRFLG